MKALSNIAELWYLYIIFSWGVWYLISDIFKALVIVFKYTSNRLEKRLPRKDIVMQEVLDLMREREQDLVSLINNLSLRIDYLQDKIKVIENKETLND